MLLGLRIQHELRQCTVQTRNLALHQRKTRAGELGACIEIQSQRRTDIGMVLDLKVEAARRTDPAHLDIIFFRFADRHACMRQIGHVEQQLLQLSLNLGKPCFVCLELLADASHIGHNGRHIFALRFGNADLLGGGVALGLQILRAGLHRLALVLEAGERCRIEPKTALIQGGDDAVEIVT